jgi:hypothetical protein
MTLALGLLATFLGAALVIAETTDRPFTRLLLGNWDAPGSDKTATPPTANKTPGNAMNGGAYKPVDPVGSAHPSNAMSYLP